MLRNRRKFVTTRRNDLKGKDYLIGNLEPDGIDQLSKYRSALSSFKCPLLISKWHARWRAT
jgi:hypothetical protein